MALEDDYRLLGVQPDASAEEVKRAWRELAAQSHPDKVADPEAKARAGRRFALMNEAYRRILDSPGITKASSAPPPEPRGGVLRSAAAGAAAALFLYAWQPWRSRPGPAAQFTRGLKRGAALAASGVVLIEKSSSPKGAFELRHARGAYEAIGAIESEREEMPMIVARPPVGVDRKRGVLVGLVVRLRVAGGKERFEVHELDLNPHGRTSAVLLRPGPAAGTVQALVYTAPEDAPSVVAVSAFGYDVAGGTSHLGER